MFLQRREKDLATLHSISSVRLPAEKPGELFHLNPLCGHCEGVEGAEGGLERKQQVSCFSLFQVGKDQKSRAASPRRLIRGVYSRQKGNPFLPDL